MKFVTVVYNQETHVGLMDAKCQKVLLLNEVEQERTGIKKIPDSLVECIAMGEGFIRQAKELKDWVETNGRAASLYKPLNKVTLLAPIPRPGKNIFCIGKNYREHAIELGSEADVPEHIMVFTKAPTTVIGPNEVVLSHREVTSQLDYEGELAVVIGKRGRAIKREEALDYVFGYTIINDVTARDLQSRHKQFFIGKSLDTTCPMGPWIVDKSEIDNPNHLNIETRVNGEVRQSSNTEKFIFPIEEIISVLSAGMTLEPGDIISTGTPAGVGKGMKPPKFLRPGDKVEVTIEKIGTLVNRIGDE
ncbi:fumarylacetoacetate hydrolase family protein [Neobacillus fumarioli]|uniref:fumarylacetoacetate hydrolase family protein n=1 Tax=Neobacillus fumarioli TaxID=105229 RepID=UPI00082C38A7|nr:fumarylacetoacetate hydrolase family protein [Neobacillus fumarioli]